MRPHPISALPFVAVCACAPPGEDAPRAADAPPQATSSDAIRLGAHSVTGTRPPRLLARNRQSTPKTLVAVTSSGQLCVLDPVDGTKRQTFGERAIDLIAANAAGSIAWTAFGDDEQAGSIARYTWSHGHFTLLGTQDLDAPDTRLLHAGSFVAGLARDMGLTLFVTWGGDAIARAIPLVSGAVTRSEQDGLTVFLLEAEVQSPRLLHMRIEGGTIRELSRQALPLAPMTCPPRLIDTGDQLLVAGTTADAVVVTSLDGKEQGRAALGSETPSCVEAALWVDHRDAVLVLSGPEPRVDWIATGGTSDAPPALELAGALWHDPLPRRRIAYDPSQERSWVALSDRLVAIETAGAVLTAAQDWTTTCDAEAVALVELPEEEGSD